MVKINISGPDGQIMESVDLSQQEPENDGNHKHSAEDVVEVEDNSGIQGVKAYQCRKCNFGWLVKIKES